MEDNENEIINEENQINKDGSENETKDYFEKYNTYYTISIILQFLDKKSLYQLMPLKKRFYELCQDILNNPNNNDKDIYLPIFKSNYTNIDDLFFTYFIYVIKGLRKIDSSKEKEKEKQKIVYNILRKIDGNKLIINKKDNPSFYPDSTATYNFEYKHDKLVPFISYFNNFYEDLEDENISLEQFTEKYGNKFQEILKEFSDDVLVFDEYCNFIFYILKLHKNIFNSEHKPKFEIIELYKKPNIDLHIININNEYHLNIIARLIKNNYSRNYNLGSNCLYSTELIIKDDNVLNRSLLEGCDYKNLKTLKLNRIVYYANKNQVLENIEFNNMVINFNDFCDLLEINKNTLKNIVFEYVQLSNRIVNNIQIKKVSKIIENLKRLEYVKFNINEFPIILILDIFICFFENFIKSKIFKYFSLENVKIKINSSSDIPSYFFNRLKIENNLIKNKFKSLINFPKEKRKGFFVKMNDLEYELFYNSKKGKIVSHLNIIDNNKIFLKNKSYKEYI
jgi:hypothetical protein